MFEAMKAWRARRAAEIKENKLLLVLYKMEFPTIDPPHEGYIIRKLSEDNLHRLLVKAELGHAQAKIAIERELRRRDAWASPAGRAFWISMAALIVSIAAFGVSILKL